MEVESGIKEILSSVFVVMPAMMERMQAQAVKTVEAGGALGVWNSQTQVHSAWTSSSSCAV